MTPTGLFPSSSETLPGDQVHCKSPVPLWNVGNGFGSEGRERSTSWGDDRLLSHSRLGEEDVREGERKEPREAGQAGPLLDVLYLKLLLGVASACQRRPVVQSPLAALLRKSTWRGASGCFILWLAALVPAGDLRVAVKRLIDGRQRGLLAEALAQAHQQRLRHGGDVHVVAEVNPGQAGELVHVLHGVSQLLHGGPRQAVAVEGQVGELGERPEEGQQQAHHVVVELCEAQVHRGEVVPVVLQVVGHAVDVPHGQGDP